VKVYCIVSPRASSLPDKPAAGGRLIGAADEPQDRNAEGVQGFVGSIRMIGRRRRSECGLKSRRAVMQLLLEKLRSQRLVVKLSLQVILAARNL